jgi:hypothetical protein
MAYYIVRRHPAGEAEVSLAHLEHSLSQLLNQLGAAEATRDGNH